MSEEEVRKKLLEIWSECLNLKEITASDNFFEIGGHSIKALMLANSIYREFGIELHMSFFFEYVTFAEQVKLISEYKSSQLEKE